MDDETSRYPQTDFAGYRFVAALICVITLMGITAQPARAQKTDACQDCRDFYKACIKAHSQAACKIDHEICMKHCRQKR